MICAIYARKSNEQNGVADEAKSVTRQVEHATAYAKKKGWCVAETHIYVDDGISGADFIRRPGFLRLMDAVRTKTKRPPFDVLVMSEESRLGREQIETSYAVKQILDAGVRVFYYLEDRERTLDTPLDKIMMSLSNFADEMERERCRQRTRDAMLRKFKAGYVTGGLVFGYDNVSVYNGTVDANGQPKRDHTERRVNEREAEVVRRIFTLAAEGLGIRRISKVLNAEGAPAPRATKGWAPSSVRVVLFRRAYVGDLTWGKSSKRNKNGGRSGTRRPESEWERVKAEHLRIVSDELWTATHARLAKTRDSYIRDNHGKLWSRPDSGLWSKYLLTGIFECRRCRGSLYVRSAPSAGKRIFHYTCQNYQLRGTRACTNRMMVPMEQLHAAVTATLEGDILHPAVLAETVRKALDALRPTEGQRDAQRQVLTRELASVETELARLTQALLTGGNLATLVEAIQAREKRRATLTQELATLDGLDRMQTFDAGRLVIDLETTLRDHWQDLLTRPKPQARQILRKLLVWKDEEDHTHRPALDEEADRYVFAGEAAIGRILAGISPKELASPTGFEPVLPA